MLALGDVRDDACCRSCCCPRRWSTVCAPRCHLAARRRDRVSGRDGAGGARSSRSGSIARACRTTPRTTACWPRRSTGPGRETQARRCASSAATPTSSTACRSICPAGPRRSTSSIRPRRHGRMRRASRAPASRWSVPSRKRSACTSSMQRAGDLPRHAVTLSRRHWGVADQAGALRDRDRAARNHDAGLFREHDLDDATSECHCRARRRCGNGRDWSTGSFLHVEKLVDRHRYRTWYERAELTADWTSGNSPRWRQMLGAWRDRPLRILEVGTYEGRASIFFLNFFPRSTFVGIDWFEGELGAPAAARLDHNMAPYGDRVEILKMDAVAALEQLDFCAARVRPHLHRREPLLRHRQSNHARRLVVDRARQRRHLGSTTRGVTDLPPEQRGATAIDEFLRERDGSYRVLGSGYQLAVEPAPQG